MRRGGDQEIITLPHEVAQQASRLRLFLLSAPFVYGRAVEMISFSLVNAGFQCSSSAANCRSVVPDRQGAFPRVSPARDGR